MINPGATEGAYMAPEGEIKVKSTGFIKAFLIGLVFESVMSEMY